MYYKFFINIIIGDSSNSVPSVIFLEKDNSACLKKDPTEKIKNIIKQINDYMEIDSDLYDQNESLITISSVQEITKKQYRTFEEMFINHAY
jgi:hypothetical protein